MINVQSLHDFPIDNCIYFVQNIPHFFLVFPSIFLLSKKLTITSPCNSEHRIKSSTFLSNKICHIFPLFLYLVSNSSMPLYIITSSIFSSLYVCLEMHKTPCSYHVYLLSSFSLSRSHIFPSFTSYTLSQSRIVVSL